MYIKIFESRETSRSYTICYEPNRQSGVPGRMYIDNEQHISLPVNEGELFYLLDTFFKGKLNEKRHEERRKDDGQENQGI
jgi:hypothetical protein